MTSRSIDKSLHGSSLRLIGSEGWWMGNNDPSIPPQLALHNPDKFIPIDFFELVFSLHSPLRMMQSSSLSMSITGVQGWISLKKRKVSRLHQFYFQRKLLRMFLA